MKKLQMKRKRVKRTSLTISLTSIVFFTFMASFAVSALGIMILARLGIVQKSGNQINARESMLYLGAFVLVVGAIFSLVISKLALKPINRLINKINDLASGDFASRMVPSEVIGRIPCFRDLTDTFNKLANELQNTELLRSDFVNNFSHEFKTPIVSIAGFAKLLKKENLTQAQRDEYLNAIEEESLRLSYMATNVLNLTKIENTSVLPEINEYNVSEQIRSCILILEGKWSKKEIDFSLDLDEHLILGNEELLKQVFINLIDNAIKFTAQNGKIDITANKQNGEFEFSITNYGCEIPKEKQKKIFNKFYQADESHSTEGNGIGLAIAKRIVDLHNGEISVNSVKDSVTFSVKLPI